MPPWLQRRNFDHLPDAVSNRYRKVVLAGGRQNLHRTARRQRKCAERDDVLLRECIIDRTLESMKVPDLLFLQPGGAAAEPHSGIATREGSQELVVQVPDGST